MADKKLARYVTVAGNTYGPDDEIPKDVRDQIDNPAAFEDADDAPPTEVVARRQSAGALGSDIKKSQK